jgi:O-antigen biosynthesis protein
MKQELVSVVIPVFNSSKFLNESIESVLNQTYKNIEVIAVDDGSADNSLEILRSYSDKIIIISQSNNGLASALNAGIAKMSGKWFKWFSPDDVMNNNMIEKLVSAAQNLPENTIVYSNWEIIDGEGKKIRNFSESDYNNLSNFDFGVRLLDGQQINVNTSLIPTSLFGAGCTIQSLEDPVAVDYDFFLRAALIYKAKFHLIPEQLVKYRIHPNQISHRKIINSLSYLELVKQNVLASLAQLEQKRYQSALVKYKKEKPASRKALEKGLTVASWALPSWLTDRLIVLYLNSIRSKR